MSLRDARRIDLHMHTARSDGKFPVDEVLARCAKGGLDAVSITDHDLTTPIAPGPVDVGGRRLHVIAGAEVSGVHDGHEHHLLVYFPGEVPSGFRDFCAAQVRARVDRYAQAIDKLALPDLAPPDDAARRGERALTRHHLARALVDAGHAKDLRDAFARWVGDAPGYVPPLPTAFVDAIRVAREHGGVTSWAHPPPKAVRLHVETFVRAGLQGLEGLRPMLSSEERKFYKKVARDHGLFLTAGSDWHGWTGDADLGLFAVRGEDLGGFLTALAA